MFDDVMYIIVLQLRRRDGERCAGSVGRRLELGGERWITREYSYHILRFKS